MHARAQIRRVIIYKPQLMVVENLRKCLQWKCTMHMLVYTFNTYDKGCHNIKCLNTLLNLHMKLRMPVIWQSLVLDQRMLIPVSNLLALNRKQNLFCFENYFTFTVGLKRVICPKSYIPIYFQNIFAKFSFLVVVVFKELS